MSKQTVQTFLDRLASAAPTPGGGGAAAINGAMAAALVSMICNLTIGRKEFAGVEAHLSGVLAKSEDLRAKLTGLVTEDAEAVDAWLGAYRLPKNSETERRTRRIAIQAGAKQAVLTPLDTARACAQVIQLGREVVKSGNPSAIGDAHAAIFCAQAGLKIAALNMLHNLELVKDNNFVTGNRSELEEILADEPELFHHVQTLIKNNSDVE